MLKTSNFPETRAVLIDASRRLILLLCMLISTLTLAAADANAADAAENGTPLTIGNRTIHVFRASLGAFSAAERALGARQRIEKAFDEPGEGWTSVKSTPHGIQVELDGKPLFIVVSGDASELAGETAEDLANKASRVLQKAWGEARERRDPGATIDAALKVVVASVLLAALLTVIVKLSRMARNWVIYSIISRLKERPGSIPAGRLGSRVWALLPAAITWLFVAMAWLLSLSTVFLYLTYSLRQFVFTRAASEGFLVSIEDIVFHAFGAVAASLPGIFISVIIFLIAWIATRISTELFSHVETTPSESAILNAHTAPATRRIVNTVLWLFAIAMAYPYLPGSHTEAFKGLSVIVGLMVSIGASGIVGQVASGLMLVYTYAFKVGEYVRIQDCEGTVTELGLFVTRLRTGLGEEIALPNAYVLANVTRNYSRAASGNAFVLDVNITIGYDTPWRQVHAMLLEATEDIPYILRAPAPFVVQTALSDFYVAYKLVANVGSEKPAIRAQTISDLHAAIQDVFNRHEVQIMSPHYMLDPTTPKIVPESDWHGPQGR